MTWSKMLLINSNFFFIIVLLFSCGANICTLHFKTKFHVLIDVKGWRRLKRKNVQQWQLTIIGRMWRFTPLGGLMLQNKTLTIYIIVTNGVNYLSFSIWNSDGHSPYVFTNSASASANSFIISSLNSSIYLVD